MQDVWELVACYASIQTISRVCHINKEYVAAIKLQRFFRALLASIIQFKASSGRLLSGRIVQKEHDKFIVKVNKRHRFFIFKD